jgi:hypothetical protein
MPKLNPTVLLFSFIVTWAVMLPPPLLIRVFYGRPLGTKAAVTICVVLFFVNHIIFGALGSQSKSHLAITVGAFVSYKLLTWHTYASAKRAAIAKRKELGYDD